VYGFQNYEAGEHLLGTYFQYTAVVGRLQMLAGVRWEQVRDTFFTMAPIKAGENRNDVTTVDFLPGIHFRYEITGDFIGRASLTRSLSRPGYFELVPATDRSDNSSTTGNPDLRPAHATNFDVRFEYYPTPEENFSVGYFHKTIIDPIEDQFGSIGVVFVTTKGNGDPAKVDGVELVANHRIGYFGLESNCTIVHSTETTTRIAPRIDAVTGDPVTPVPTVTYARPLMAQSPFVLNLALSYDNEHWGTSANVAYNYTGRRLVAVSNQDGLDTYEDEFGELDFSAEQNLFSGLRMNVKLANLTNAKAVTEIPGGQVVLHDALIIQRDITKLRGSIGFIYRL
jgi:TonB-dependent receptor